MGFWVRRKGIPFASTQVGMRRRVLGGAEKEVRGCGRRRIVGVLVLVLEVVGGGVVGGRVEGGMGWCGATIDVCALDGGEVEVGRFVFFFKCAGILSRSLWSWLVP